MLLSPVVDGLKSDLQAAAAVGGEETQRAAGILLGALEAALRFRVLDVLQEAADEVSASLPGLQVELRLTGRDPSLVASLMDEGGLDEPEGRGEEAEMARITLRISESLKSRVEQAASRKGVSVNSWLVSAAAQALSFDAPKGRAGKRISGFVRG
jgi:predicted HicB family RNase H-like nuclease